MIVTKITGVLAGLALVLASLTVVAPIAQAQVAQSAPTGQGLVVIESTQSFEQTWSALIGALDANAAIRTIAEVDHGASASAAGLSLENNRVVFFGNPNLGTPIMQANRAAGIDLPQKMQVFEIDTQVFVAYNPPSYLAARHGVGSVATLTTIEGALAGLARTATNTQGSTPVPVQASPGATAGLTTTASDNDFETTWTQLTAAIEASPASVAFTVDHGANSGGTLGPTRLVVFGNPAIGTPIMASQPSAGIDLPLKMLVYEDDAGVTQVVSTAPSFVQSRHGVGNVATIGGATNAIANFTTAATVAPATDDQATDDQATDDEVLGVSELAFTGSNPANASLAVVLLGAGAALVVAGRRTRRVR